MREVLMSHDKLDGRVISVPETAVPVHMASGWKVVEGEKAEAKAADKLAEDTAASLAPSVEESDSDSGSKSTRRSASKE